MALHLALQDLLDADLPSVQLARRACSSRVLSRLERPRLPLLAPPLTRHSRRRPPAIRCRISPPRVPARVDAALSGGSSSVARSRSLIAAPRSPRAYARRPAVSRWPPALRGAAPAARRAARARPGSGTPARGGSRRSRRSSTSSAPCSLEPVGEALVQLGARRLRQRVVGGVADQQVAEAERVVAGELRAVGADQLLAHERGQARRRPRGSSGRERLRRRRGGRPRPRPRRARARARSCRRRAGRGARRAAPGSSAARRRSPSADSRSSASSSSTKSGLPSAASTDPARAGRRRALAAEQLVDQRVRLVRRERLEQHRRRVQLAAAPGRAPLEQLRPGHAEEQDRCVAREVGDVLDQVEERRLAPVDVVEDDDERPLARSRLEQLAERPGDLLAGRRRTSRSPSRPRIAVAATARPPSSRVGRDLRQLLDDLDDRPVGDALAVGQAAAAQRRARRRRAAEELGRRAATCRRRPRRGS